jgi:hypothetical protein
MTNSTSVQTTHTKPHPATVSLKTQAGSPKPDIAKKQKTFMQRYRDYSQLLLVGRLGDKRPTINPLVIARYGLDDARLFERYDSLNHRLMGCGIHQRIHFRQQAFSSLPNWPEQSLRLNKMWRTWG